MQNIGILKILMLIIISASSCTKRDITGFQKKKGSQEELLELKKSVENIKVKIKDIEDSFFILSDRVLKIEEKLEKIEKAKVHNQSSLTFKEKKQPSRKNSKKIKASPPEPKKLYDSALKMVRNGKCDRAIPLFLKLISKYPTHSLADNSAYWTGECYYDKKDYDSAINYFLMVIEDYPDGNKVPDAMLKLGLTYNKVGMHSKGKKYLEDLISIFPLTEPAKKAKIFINNMQVDLKR